MLEVVAGAFPPFVGCGLAPCVSDAELGADPLVSKTVVVLVCSATCSESESEEHPARVKAIAAAAATHLRLDSLAWCCTCGFIRLFILSVA